MTDELSEKLDAVVANVRALAKSGFPRADAAERALEIERQCVDLLTLWVRKYGMFEAHEYREAEAALDRLREAVKKESASTAPPDLGNPQTGGSHDQ